MRWIGAILALVCCAAVPAQVGLARDKTITVDTADAEMNSAIAKARASLTEFWQHFESPGPGEEGFSLKVRIPYGGNNVEHFWLGDIARKNDRLSGVINNDPNHALQVQRGQRYEFTQADISDWLFMRNGKMVGNQTMRPLLSRMPKEQADQYRELLEAP